MLRTPYLSWTELAQWGGDLDAPSASDDALDVALDSDVERLRHRTRALLAIPGVREAIFLASPDLEASLATWEADPTSENGARTERGLIRYLSRMCGRATPFAHFAGCCVGTTGGTTQMVLGSRAAYRRTTRLDADYVSQLCTTLAATNELRDELTYRRNSSLYRAGGQWRFVQWSSAGEAAGHHLAAMQQCETLDRLLGEATTDVTVAQLSECLQRHDPTLSPSEALDSVHRLIDQQLFVPNISPTIMGTSAVDGVVGQLRATRAGRAAAAALTTASELFGRIDASPRGVCAERYRQVARALDGWAASVDISSLFDVTLVPAVEQLTVGRPILDEIARGVGVLQRIAMRRDPLRAFRRAFQARYEEREVPLCEVLDDDLGIGLPGVGVGARRPRIEQLDVDADTARQTYLAQLLIEASRRGDSEIRLTDRDVERLAASTQLPMPSAFAATVTVVGSPAAVNAGDFRILMHDASGPSGATLLGRFCSSDANLDARVQNHLREEDALHPDAVVAEIVHWPRGRVGNGNIIGRPAHRDYEIPYLGHSSGESADQIAVDDVWLRLDGDRLVLRSARLGREIIPRLTTAHNFAHAFNLPIYRLLGMLQTQGTHSRLEWSWGHLAAMSFLPRVVVGQCVLSRAQWTLNATETTALHQSTRTARFKTVRALREARSLPRYVVVAEGDNLLPMDLDAALSVDAFVDLVRKRGTARLLELYPSPEDLAVTGPDGSYVHELVVPFVRRVAQRVSVPSSTRLAGDAIKRRFTPTSEWVTVSLYMGQGSADRALRELVGPIVDEARRSACIDSWFFVRYLDPEFHLRVRLHGDPRRMRASIIPLIEERASQWMDAGLLTSLRYDTYVREVERYGGALGIELAERLFCADSDAVRAMVDACPREPDSAQRALLALRGVDTLLGDFRLTDAQTAEALHGWVSPKPDTRRKWSGRYRERRRQIEVALGDDARTYTLLSDGARILDARSAVVHGVVEELRAADASGQLTRPIVDLVRAFLHMHVNRFMQRNNPMQEQMYYDVVRRHRESARARARAVVIA